MLLNILVFQISLSINVLIFIQKLCKSQTIVVVKSYLYV